jgi:YbbR domain-containing protein
MRSPQSVTSWWQISLRLARSSVTTVFDHWALAGFSLVAAFGIWFVIEDVENPRVTANFPGEGLPASIQVEPVNAGEFIVAESYSVSVVVEGREEELANLTPGDFEATVDVQGVQPGAPEAREVRVRSTRDGVRVLEVQPAAVNVTVVRPEQREFPVTINRSGQLPPGYVEDEDETTVEPFVVTVTGLPERVESVHSVELDVNLNGVTDNPDPITGTLVARNESGGTETVTISPPRATVILAISQTTVQRALPVTVRLNGEPAPGFRVAGIVVDPPTIRVTGPTAVMAELNELNVRPIDQVAGAQGDVEQTLDVEIPLNTSLEPQTVTVRVIIEPVGVAGTYVVPVQVSDIPQGLALAPQPLVATVTVRGMGQDLAGLQVSDITATVSLAGAASGTAAFPVTVTVPNGLTASQPPPLTVSLVAATP